MFPFHALAVRNTPSSNRGSAVKHPEHVLTFPQVELSKKNRFDHNNWRRVQIDPNDWDYPHNKNYRNMTLVEASSKKDVEYDFIDDIGFNESKWEKGSYAKLQCAITSSYINEK